MFFHVSHDVWSEGDVITPGEWGKKLRSLTYATPPNDMQTVTTLLWEVALETARIAVDKNSPSRMACVFVVETIEMAKTFREKYRPNAFIYKVAPIAENFRVHRGDFGLISRARNGTPPYVEYMSSEAVQYWTTAPAEEPEILVSCAVRIMGRLE